MSVDHWAGHWLSDHSRRETGKITGLRVGARGWCTQPHSQNLLPRQTWPSSQGPSAPRRGRVTHLPPGQPSRPDDSSSSVLSAFLLAGAPFFPSQSSRGTISPPSGGSGQSTSKGKQGGGTCPWGRAHLEAPPTRRRRAQGALISCAGCVCGRGCKVNRGWQARSFGQICIPKRVSRSGRSSSSRSSSPNEILSPH